MTEPGSISQCIAAIQNVGDVDALERICDRYYEQLAAMAGRKLHSAAGRVADNHAIANEALYGFFDRAQQGVFSDVNNRGDLLPLLIRLTKDRVTDEIRRLTAKKRGGGKTRGNSVIDNGDSQQANGFDAFADTFDCPSTRQIVREEAARIRARLPDQAMQTILVLRAEGYKNEEIAKELNISLATVERKRRRMRDILSDLESSQ